MTGGGGKTADAADAAAAARDVLACMAEIARAETLEDAWRLTCGGLDAFGFDRLNYGCTWFRVGRNIGDPADALFLTSHPPELTRRFFDEGLYARTPMFRWAAEHVGACSWRWACDEHAAGRLGPKEAAAQAEVEAAGYTVSFPETSARIKGAIGLCARPGLDHDAVEAIWTRHGLAIEALCNMAHLKLSQMPVPSVRLTERQREILEWVADGKTLQDVCILTGLSLSAVDKHLGRARERLGVGTTAQAVAKMSFLNQMFLKSPGAP